MTNDPRISDELKCAFVDGELGRAEWARVAEQAQRDERLRDDLCGLRSVKELVQHAYPAAAQRARPSASQWGAVAALCLVSVAAGWFGKAAWSPDTIELERALTAGATLREIQGDRIVVHVSTSRRETIATALEEAEDALRAARQEGRRLQLEIVANSSGLDMFRADAAPFPARLATLQATYPGVTLVACNQTIDRLREKGIEVRLLPGVQVAPSALDQVVKRLQGGWAYVRA
jgi:intracellular sulfur oxidation DsrE/DsrF family protein